LIMPQHQLGTAYGLMTAVQNLGLAVAPLAIGGILNATKNYLLIELIFSGIAAVAAAITVVLIFVDMARGRKLNSTPGRLKRLKLEQQSQETQPLLVNDSQT